jgi:hypothetical protein
MIHMFTPMLLCNTGVWGLDIIIAHPIGRAVGWALPTAVARPKVSIILTGANISL